MSLAPGARLGPYEIVSLLGAGGMGEVYKARDGRLDRTVAIKVLPARLSASPELKQRLDREARIISQLAHPHVCALFDLGHHEGIDYFVMELLEGETLAARIARGPLPLSDVRRFGAQIADALDAAHRQGVIHRDLKPANVMLTSAGVKLLDFGIAKPMPAEAGGGDSTRMAPALTEEGMVLGTAQYMSPEQIGGKPVTSSSDIFALGTLLYEMIAGRPPFTGASRTALLTAILESDPVPVSSIVSAGAGALETIVSTCLKKDPLDRWRSAHDVAIQLRSMLDTGSQVLRPSSLQAPTPTRPRVLSWLGWVVAAAALAGLAVTYWRTSVPGTPASRTRIAFELRPPAETRFLAYDETLTMALSPDGLRLAYVGQGRSSQNVWIHSLSNLEARLVAGTDEALSVFWSPDGKSIAFVDAAGKLKRIDLDGGSAVTVCDLPAGIGIHGTWGDGQIVFSTVEGHAIFGVSTSGGEPAVVLEKDASKGEQRISWPWFLPDGKRFLYLLRRGYDGRVMLWEPGKPPRELMQAASNVQYVEPGYLVFVREGTLLAQRFDKSSGTISGEPMSLAESVHYFLSTGAGAFTTSLGGAVAFRSRPDVSQLTWFDRTGREVGTLGPPGDYNGVSLAPDGKMAAVSRIQPNIGTYDLWTIDLARNIDTRLTSGVGSESAPVWFPDNRALVFNQDRGAPPHLFRKDLMTGDEKELLPGSRFQAPLSVTPDGSTVIYQQRSARGSMDLLTLGPSGKPSELIATTFSEQDARLSPDGRLLSFVSDESGMNEVYVTSFPPAGRKTRVTAGGGFMPRWSRDSRQLYYRTARGPLTSVAVRLDAEGSLVLGDSAGLFPTIGEWVAYDVAADGRFLAVVRKEIGTQQPLTVVVNALR